MNHGIVSEYLLNLVARQVEDCRLVVWYDPDGVYTSVAEKLDLLGATVARYDGSFLKLRRDIDGLLNNLEPPKLVVYVPEDQAKTHNALAELEAAGVVMQSGQQPPARNTRLAVAARNALKPILGDDTALEVERQVEAGKLSLADVNALAEKGQGISKGVVALVFGSGKGATEKPRVGATLTALKYGFQKRDEALGRNGLRSSQSGVRVARCSATNAVSRRHTTWPPLAAKVAPFLTATDSQRATQEDGLVLSIQGNIKSLRSLPVTGDCIEFDTSRPITIGPGSAGTLPQAISAAWCKASLIFCGTSWPAFRYTARYWYGNCRERRISSAASAIRWATYSARSMPSGFDSSFRPNVS